MRKDKTTRPNLLKVRKLAAEVLECGRNKIWLDPAEATALSEGKTKEQVEKMVEDGLIIRRPDIGHSRGRARQYRLEKSKGRHTGMGKRKGTRNARFSERKIWILRIRAIRKELKLQREEGKIDRTMYREMYLKAKGGYFKNSRILKDYIVAEEMKKRKEEMVMAQMAAAK